MSTEKFKTEQYQNFGGINSKLSPYATGPMEFLDLRNLDFQKPGSLSLRWGSTQYIGQTFPNVSALGEYAKLDGSSYLVVGCTGGLWIGASTGLQKGVSFAALGATSSFRYFVWTNGWGVAGAGPTNGYIAGSLKMNYQDNPLMPMYASNNGFGLDWAGAATMFINPMTQVGNDYDFTTVQNYLFGADGNMFWKFDGSTAFPIGLPHCVGFSYSINSATSGTSLLLGTSTGCYAVYGSYVNYRGFEGRISPLAIVNTNMVGTSLGATFIQAKFNIPAPVSYGISSINLYYYYSATAIVDDSSKGFFNAINGASYLWSLPYTFLQNVPLAGGSIISYTFGTTIGGHSAGILRQNSGPLPTSNQNYIFSFGFTAVVDYPNIAGTTGFDKDLYEIDLGSKYPRYLEQYQNRLFLAGFSTSPSTVAFSDTGEPEGYQADWNFEVRTNDGDFITCMKSYSTRLYIFKKNSFHILTGDNPQNFFLQEISDQYGCMNNRCAVVYDDILVFLDRKGVIMWNGAGLSVLSNKIQPTIDTMNYANALNTARMVHDKLRNQILIAIPTGNSSTNDTTLVYDYLIGAWTIQQGYTPSVFEAIQGRNNTKNVFYGDTSGRVNWFGSSFLSDNGTGFTAYIKTRFLHEMGDSTQKMYRRLFLNTDSPASSTLVFGVNFYQDYGSSIVLGSTIVLSDFQNRIDYGISAKSLAFELVNLQTALPLRIHGFTIESRYLRRV